MPLVGLKMKDKRKNLENGPALSTLYKHSHALHILTIVNLKEKHSRPIQKKKITRNLQVVTDNNYCFAAKFSACGPHLLKAYNTVHYCASL